MAKREIYTDEGVRCGRCRHLVHWYATDSLPENFWGRAMESDVVERPCPHENGTMIEHCPRCDERVGMWGFGLVGSMECSCWDEDPWYWKLYDLTVGRLIDAVRRSPR